MVPSTPKSSVARMRSSRVSNEVKSRERMKNCSIVVFEGREAFLTELGYDKHSKLSITGHQFKCLSISIY